MRNEDGIYLGMWDEEGGRQSVFDSFMIPADSTIEIIVACYGVDGYDGYAMVVFFQDDKLYEVHGSHCSCYGLEDQWRPEPVVVRELLNRPSYSMGRYDESIRAALRLQIQAIR